MNYKQESERLFDGLFVLELANNHWGNVDRGLRIITDFSRIVRFNNVKASIKLQFRTSTVSFIGISASARTSATSRRRSIRR